MSDNSQYVQDYVRVSEALLKAGELSDEEMKSRAGNGRSGRLRETTRRWRVVKLFLGLIDSDV